MAGKTAWENVPRPECLNGSLLGLAPEDRLENLNVFLIMAKHVQDPWDWQIQSLRASSRHRQAGHLGRLPRQE